MQDAETQLKNIIWSTPIETWNQWSYSKERKMDWTRRLICWWKKETFCLTECVFSICRNYQFILVNPTVCAGWI